MTMPARTGLIALICCCAGLTACTGAARNGPDATVTTPSVGRPPAPVSAQADLSAEAFTPYAGLGASTDDGLAPGDTYAALHTACMNAGGYGQYANAAPFGVRENRGLAFAQPFGPWGYIGTALAAEDGFAQNTAQIATAVADADCTQATDLAGIYFGAQASYEQQFVDANQQALTAAVRHYKAAFATELSKLPGLLRTTSATPDLPHGPRHPAGAGHS
jgi:hypothetical protein